MNKDHGPFLVIVCVAAMCLATGFLLGVSYITITIRHESAQAIAAEITRLQALANGERTP